MEFAHDSESFSLFTSCRNIRPRERSPASTVAAVVRILEFLNRPRVAAMSSAWLRQHEVDCDKHGQA
jgi:hypothetical protein